MYYIGAYDTSLAEHLDNASCCIRGIIDFGVHRGTTTALRMGEICSGCRLRDIISPLSSLSDEGLENLLEGYPKDILMYLVLAKIMKPLLIGSP